MKFPSARRTVPACILSAATVAALAVPGIASASEVGTQCSGENVTGQGSSLQAVAQQKVWTPEFNLSTAKGACSGKQGDKLKPEVTYTSTGSGAGLKSWGAETKTGETISFAKGNGFLGTDEPPNASQAEEIEKQQDPLGTATDTVLTIPVLQGAVAIIVDLPTGCTATSKAAVGRLVLNNKALEAIYKGGITEWGQLTEDGDKLTPSSCDTDTIQPVVRFDQSGTTHIFKRYLNLINSSTLAVEGGGSDTWGELSEGSLNTTWPTAAKVIRPTEKGGGALGKLVAATPGTIGYINLAEARTNGAFTPGPGNGGPKTQKFWVELQNGEKEVSKKITVTYADPSTNKDAEAAKDANCKSTVYANGSEATFPPPAVTAPWNEVSTTLTSKTYSLCGLTYDVAFNGYSAYPLTSLKEATTVENYLHFVTETAGGQKLIENHDYLSLPKGEVLEEAQGGAKLVGF